MTHHNQLFTCMHIQKLDDEFKTFTGYCKLQANILLLFTTLPLQFKMADVGNGYP